MIVDLDQGVTFHADGTFCQTRYPDGHVMAAIRDPSPDNLREARDQGYSTVWQSLVEHEILHTLVARQVWGQESVVLRHECGAEPTSYAWRTLEEGLVLSLQVAMNGGRWDPVLNGWGLLAVGMRARGLAKPLL